MKSKEEQDIINNLKKQYCIEVDSYVTHLKTYRNGIVTGFDLSSDLELLVFVKFKESIEVEQILMSELVVIPNGVLVVKTNIPPEQIKKFKDAWENEMRNPNNKPIIIDHKEIEFLPLKKDKQ
jgi:hypothetical protein